MFVKPAQGRAVRDPSTMRLLTDEGMTVPDASPFWARRVRDGDVVVVDDIEPKRDRPARNTAAAVTKGE
jgi:hypothetical protein